MTRRAHVIAVDVGTSSVRAALVDETGRIVEHVREPRPDGVSGVAFDAGLLWRQLCVVLRRLRERSEEVPEALCIAAHVGTVLVDADLRPVGLAGGWADATGVETVEALAGDDLPELLRVTGRPHLSGGVAAAAVAVRATRPQDFDRVRFALPPKDYLNARLTGAIATDFTSAAYTGVSSVADRAWSPALMGLLHLPPSMFPEQLSSVAVMGAVSVDAASRTGLPRGLPVVTGAPDGTAGACSVLRSDTGVVADISGTTDVLVRVATTPEEHVAGAVLNPYPLGTLWSQGGATGATGGAVTYWSQLLGGATGEDVVLERALATTPPGARGLRIRTTMSGSRFPTWRPEDRGGVRGQLDRHGASDFLRAAAEGAAFTVREGVDLLADGGAVDVVLAGGAARSPQLAQLRADVLGRRVLVCEEPDVSLLGAGLLALEAVRPGSSDQVARVVTRAVLPERATASAYESFYQAWLDDRP